MEACRNLVSLISRITDNLFLGDFADAKSVGINYPNVDIVVVTQESLFKFGEPTRAIWIPAFKLNPNSTKDEDDLIAIPSQLDKIADFLELQEKNGRKTFIHCAEGRERSPLAVIWFLFKKKNMTLERAYRYVKTRRPLISDRLHWLPKRYLEH